MEMDEDLDGWGAADASQVTQAKPENDLNVRQMVANQNRKNKKSGGFQSMGLSKPVFRGIFAKGYKVPTPVQRKAIPLILEGKDIVAMARTGSGKTACFLLPMFEKLQVHSAKVGARALILSPTRELALQTLKFTKELGKFTGLRAAVVLGGDSMEAQFAAIHNNPDIVIATPGRLTHICIEMNLQLSSIEYVVFDEADRLFELGFKDQLNEICKRLSENRQTLLFSATLPKMLVEFARAGLTDPILVRLDVESKLSESLRLAYFRCKPADKTSLLVYMLRSVINPFEQTVVFVATRLHVEYLQTVLHAANIDCTYIYSSLDQAARKINVAKFREKVVNCMIVTDVAALGIDLPLLDNVINYNFPAKPKLFVHRVGRVARAGRTGMAYSFVAPEEEPYLLDLHIFLGRSIKFAGKQDIETNSFEDGTDAVYGSAPLAVVQHEADLLTNIEQDPDVDKLKQKKENAYKQYVRSRPLPSPESCRRIKEARWTVELNDHPILLGSIKISIPAVLGDKKEEEKRANILECLRVLRPKTTVFEFGKKKGDTALELMQAKRRADDTYINNFHDQLAQKKNSVAVQQLQGKKAASTLEQTTEADVATAFTQVVQNRKAKRSSQTITSSSNNDTVSTDSHPSHQHTDTNSDSKSDYFLPYRPKDMFTEQGYAVGSSFERETQEATLDLTQDDDDMMKKKRSQVKWDRKRKKFVGPEQTVKKIKTESGVWINASYKTDRYKKWKLKNNLDKQTLKDEDGVGRGPGDKKFKTLPTGSYSRKHPLLAQKTATDCRNSRIRDEVKNPDQIRKHRKMQQRYEKDRRRGAERKKNKPRDNVKSRKKGKKQHTKHK